MKQGKKLALRLCVLLAVMLTVVTIGIVGLATEAEPVDGPVCYHHGDVNGDGAVDSRDAIYTLYNVLLGEEEYPAGQDLDFNGDAHMDSRDAIYVLYAYMNEDDPDYAYKLDGLVHNYFDPVWKWEETSATVTLKCGCGEVTTLTTGSGVTVKEVEKQAATCVAAGFTTYQATVDGMEYADTKQITVPAGNGHSMVGTQDCENGSYCQLCDYKLEPLGHQWKADAGLSVAATCTTKGVQGYRCGACQQTKTVEQEGSVGHQYAYMEGKDLSLGNCMFAKQYQCAVCQDVIRGTAASDTYSVHSYKATLTKEATCKQEGEKTYNCVNGCGHSYAEAVATNDSHTWDEGVQGDGVKLFTCTGCGETKTTVSVTADTAVSKEQLSSELQLENDAALTVDQSVVENLDAKREIKISVDAVKVDELETDKALSAEEKAQIGDNVVYDFNMVYADNNDKVEFKGEITVSLPYTLQPGDDIDSIDVWFIADDGALEQVNGTYSNGFVTFTTDHFSYYTVTRLTPAQRCARYGHIPVETNKQATCTEDGYTMSVCQRCAAELTKEVYKMSGHDMETETTAATCTAEGQTKQTCKTCGHTVTEILPALGHVLQADAAQAVTASCTAAGKDVYVCTRGGCDYVREDAKPQLEHQYAAFEEKAADCSNKGYKTEKCDLCGDVKTVEETAPLGHKFTNDGAVWSWAADHSSATLVLTCANDKAHTKTLTAVVTETVTDSTCTGNGAVTYTAEAAYNNYIFKDEKVITQNAPGHMIGTAWESNGDQHYHVCSVCEEKVDTAAHNWNSGTVTKAPTCAESGTKVVKCTVCNYSKEQVLPATGAHNLVNGTCTVCNYKEGSCEHLILKRTQVDMSAYAICAGTEIWKESCECGQVSYCTVESIGCTMEDGDPVDMVAPNGATVKGYVYECSECGLAVQECNYRDGKNNPCVGAYYSWFEMTLGGKTILESSNVMMEREHLGCKQIGIIDLTTEQYGLCAEKLEVMECACGKNREYNVISYCDWEWDPSYNGEGNRNICLECGATREQLYNEKPAVGCAVEESSTIIYTKDGKEIYRVTNNYIYYSHDLELTGYEKFGESCEDGILFWRTCADCGEVDKDYAEYHRALLRETIDLSNSDICYDSVTQLTCLCDEKHQAYDWDGEATCSWMYGEYDPQTGRETYTCETCEATRSITYKNSEKNENCEYLQEETVTFADRKGTVLATVFSRGIMEDHNMMATGTLLGEDCEDGIKVTNCCVDCGYSYSYTSEGHETLDLQYYQLSDYGMCGGEIIVRGCLCGDEVWTNRYNTYCQWEYVEDSENSSIYRCGVCGAQREISYAYENTEHPCIEIESVTFVYSRGEEELLRFGYTGKARNHKDTYKLTLDPGATSCEQGYTVTRTCTVCGETDTWREYEHMTYTLKQEVVGEGVMCSPAILEYYACACGKDSGTDFEWSDHENSCSYREYYDDKLGIWVWECVKCGVTRTHTYEENVSPDHPCEFVDAWHYIYSKDGKELFSYDENSYGTRHLQETHFQMLGETCSDGYYVSWSCKRCGETESDSELYYGCENYQLEITEVYNGEELCGPVYVERIGCACGAQEEYDCEYSCSFAEYGYDSQLGHYMLKCRKCDALQTNSWESREIEGTCNTNETMYYAFYRDGVLLAEINEQWIEKSHKLVYTYSLYGETCEDGYDATYRCIYCDYTGSETERYDHSTEYVQYYNLKDYGICEGYLLGRNCACGYYSYGESNVGCQWEPTGKKDPATGATEYYCEECDAYWYYKQSETPDRDNCKLIGTVYYKWTRDDAVLLETLINTSREDHAYEITDVVFTDPELGCAGGYEVTIRCENCEYTETEWGNDHNYYESDVWYLSEFGGCGGKVTLSQCPCGMYGDIDYDWSCYMDYDGEETGDDRNGSGWSTRTCSECGIVYREESSWSIPEDSCEGTQTVKTTLSYNGNQVAQWDWKTVYSDHTYVMTGASLNNSELGCLGGYTRYMSCMYCDDSYTSSGSSSHNEYLVEQMELSDLGACGGTIKLERCPCGQMSSIRTQWDCQMGGYGDGNGDDHSGYNEDVADCGICGLHVVDRTDWSVVEGSCAKAYHQTVTASMNGAEQSLQADRIVWNHRYKMTDYTLDDPERGCQGGYYYTAECVNCGDSYSSTGSGHNTAIVEYLELNSVGACGGYVALQSCACGEEVYLSTSWDCNMVYEYDSTGDEWNGTETQTRTCSVCDLQYKRVNSWTIPEGACTGIKNIAITLTLGDMLETYSWAETYVNHKWNNTFTLQPGSVTCEDGVISYAECEFCDATSSNIIYWHEPVVVETIDLAKYGSVCGGALERRICACGQRQTMQFSADTLCDLSGSQSIPVWIEGIETNGQYTSEGWIYLENYANKFICAVTDPQCGLYVRNANYWLKKGCEVVEYQTWQLGYDEATDTYLKEVTFPTGYKYAYHAYNETEIDETTADGLRVQGESFECPDCGSTFYEKDWYDADGNRVKWMREGVNTLDNGENKYWYEVYEYTYVPGALYENNYYSRTTLTREEYVYADGSQYWYQNSYSYGDGCVRTCVYSNSNGIHQTTTDVYHNTNSEYEYLRRPSCSQSGVRHWTEDCYICGQRVREYDEKLEAYDHSFYWNSSLGVYECYRCDLQNTNGISGSIIMEDLSDANNYIVGYYNREDLEFQPYVSMFLYDVGEDQNDELVLTGIDFRMLTVEEDGICALSCSKADVFELAHATCIEAGYAGEYSIRISFVPINGDDTLDYAITFDDRYAQ